MFAITAGASLAFGGIQPGITIRTFFPKGGQASPSAEPDADGVAAGEFGAWLPPVGWNVWPDCGLPQAAIKRPAASSKADLRAARIPALSPSTGEP
ncbi:MAG: hypothetical protein J2P34_05075 [Actinobacteria bacterium]|nr:hypothetical protein [Actinomycetota bacterium]